MAQVVLQPAGPVRGLGGAALGHWHRALSGSLYALALGGPRWLGPVTPLGGAALISGWVLAAAAALAA